MEDEHDSRGALPAVLVLAVGIVAIAAVGFTLKRRRR